MNRIRSALRAIVAVPGRVVGGIAGAVRAVVEPLLPEEGTTEAAMYFGLLLIAAGFLVRGQPELALLVPGSAIALLAAAPVIVGVLRKGG